MFGEYVLYLDGWVVVLVCDNMLFVKLIEVGCVMFDMVEEVLLYFGVKFYWCMDEVFDDGEWFGCLFIVIVVVLLLFKLKVLCCC